MLELIEEMRREWAELDARIAALDREFVETARASAPARATNAAGADRARPEDLQVVTEMA